MSTLVICPVCETEQTADDALLQGDGLPRCICCHAVIDVVTDGRPEPGGAAAPGPGCGGDAFLILDPDGEASLLPEPSANASPIPASPVDACRTPESPADASHLPEPGGDSFLVCEPDGDLAPIPEPGGEASLIDMIKERLTDRNAQLPTIPLMAQQVLSTSQDPNCSIRNLDSVIRKDQVLGAKVIQVANSSFYRGLSEVKSLPDAIMRLGLKGVRNIALAVAVKNVYQGKNERHLEVMRELWNHSVLSAVACRELASSARYPKEEKAFLAGLVHDIGTVFIVDSLDRMAGTDERVARLPEDIFQELLRVLHEEMGARLLEAWTFPKAICDAVRHHHDPAGMPEPGKLAWILAASDLVLRKIELDASGAGADMTLPNTPPMQALQLGDLEIAKVLVDLEDKARELLGALR